MNEEPEESPRAGRGVIGLRTALILYGLLTLVAVLVLKGKALGLALIIVAGVAIKSYTGYLRHR